MNAQKKPEPVVKINVNTVLTSISSGLILAGILWVVTSISSLQKNQIKLNDTMQELQMSINRLNSKK